MHEERDNRRTKASLEVLASAKWLEKMGLVLGVRSFAKSDAELSILLTPPRPGTAERHLRMFNSSRSMYKAANGRFENTCVADVWRLDSLCTGASVCMRSPRAAEDKCHKSCGLEQQYVEGGQWQF